MKYLFYSILICGLLMACNTPNKVTASNEMNQIKDNDTVTIANDAIEYEIIIIEPGFNFWLNSTARPEGYYSQEYLESRNRLYVMEWNQRVLNPIQYGRDLYLTRIDYDSRIDYGYEVNYILYNYFIYFQLTYKQKLTGYVPRI